MEYYTQLNTGLIFKTKEKVVFSQGDFCKNIETNKKPTGEILITGIPPIMATEVSFNVEDIVAMWQKE